MRSKGPVYVIAGIAGLILLAWIAGDRLKNVDMPTPTLGSLAATPGVPLTLDDMGKAAKTAFSAGQDSGLPVLAQAMPEFTDISAWLNSPALTSAALKGKVVLIDFWTYSCINCLRTLPYVTSWQGKYGDKGFTVIGVHTPEFDFEKKEANVRQAIKDHGITYPVPLDNGYGTWNAYGNRYWPAEYLFDAQGRLRYTHFGEGNYDRTETNIQLLLAEAGMKENEQMTELPSTTDFNKIGTPETYLGYGRMEYLGSPESVEHDKPKAYSAAKTPKLNEFYFSGTWNVHDEYASPVNAGAELVYRYDASTANLVVGSFAAVVAEVTLDGAAVPEALAGSDLYVDGGKTYVKIQTERLYNLIDAKGNYGEHLLRIKFLRPGADAYAFTFG